MTAARPAFALDCIGQIALTVRDVPRAVAFYRDALGLPFLFAAPPNLAFFGVGGVRLMLTAPEGNDVAVAGSSTVLYFKVADIGAAHAALRERGVLFVDEPHLIARMADHDLWMVFFRDPDQHLIGLMSEIPHMPPRS